MKKMPSCFAALVLVLVGFGAADPPPSTPVGPGDRIGSITLGRSGTGLTTPGYDVTLRPDGSVRYEGHSNVARRGVHTGRIDPEDFRRLVTLVERSGFWAAPESYPQAPDVGFALLETRTELRTKTIRNPHGSNAPVELWGLEMAIDGLVASIQDWTPEAAAVPPPARPDDRAVAIARAYYHEKHPAVDVTRYKASAEKDGKLWHVRLVGDPPKPGDFVSIFVDEKGQVTRFVGGE